MIDKKLNEIKDKIHIKSIGDEDLFLTKEETKYLLRLLEIAEADLKETEDVATFGTHVSIGE